MTRARRALLIGAIALSLLIAGTLAWRQLNRPEDAARLVAERIATGLAQGTLDHAALTGAGPAEDDEVAAILKGLGSLRPRVSVQALALGPDGTSANARLAYEWTIHAGKTPWRYDAFLTLRRDDSGWRGVFDRTLLHPQLLAGLRLKASRLAPVRGEIVGAEGARLVWNQPASRVGIDKTRVDAVTAQASARALAAVLSLDPARLAARVKAAGSKAFVEAAVLRRNEEPDRGIAERALGIEGVRSLATVRPLPRSPGFAAPLLGRVGEATAEVIEKSGGAVREGDLVGLSGLQASANDTLTGTTGFRVFAYEAANPVVETELFRVEAVPGGSVTLTLDAGLQTAAERTLADLAPTTAVVAIRPSDGAILAAAEAPGGTGPTALRALYPPGSAFRPVTLLAALRAGVALDDPVSCGRAATVNGTRVVLAPGYPADALGDISLRTAAVRSCDTALVRLADRVDQDRLVAAAGALGLGEAPSLGVPAALGSVPADASDRDHAASLIGRGGVRASPLGLAALAASLAEGRTVTPRLLAGTPVAQGEPLPEARSLRALLTAGAEGPGRILADLPGSPALSLAGTAPTSAGRGHAWMIAIRGDLAVAAYVPDETGGPATAALLKRLLLAAD